MSNWLDPSRPKLPPGALFAIPDDLLADIYTIWLRLKDVCRLDSAVCSKIWRPPFLRLVSTKVLRFNREEIDVLDDFFLSTITHQYLELPEMNWILKRGIHLATLRVYVDSYRISKSGSNRIPKAFDVAITDLLNEGRLDNLETIDMCGDCSYIKDAELAAILEKSYSTLKCIDLRYSCLTKSSAAHIKRCTGLEAFAAKGNESAADIVEIVQSCRKLRKLNLSLCNEILTYEVMQSVATYCRDLVHFNVRRCNAVSDAAIIRVAQSCPSLLCLNLSRTKISDLSVASFCSHCPLLEVLDLNECNITDSSLEKIGKHCSKLRVLSIVGCAGVTCLGLVAFAKTCINIRNVSISQAMRHELHRNSLMLSVMFPHISWHCFSIRSDLIWFDYSLV